MEGSESLASRSDFIATKWEPYTEALPVVEKDIFTASRESVDWGGGGESMGCRIGRGETEGKKLPNKKVLAYTPEEMTKCGASASSSLRGQRIDYCNPNWSDITFRSALAGGGRGSWWGERGVLMGRERRRGIRGTGGEGAGGRRTRRGC